MMSFIASFGPSGWRGYDPSVWNSPFVLGETHSNNHASEPSGGTTCDGYGAPAYAPWATVGGFNQSTLAGRYVNGSPGTIFRPWNYPEGSCNLFPNPMGPYYP